MSTYAYQALGAADDDAPLAGVVSGLSPSSLALSFQAARAESSQKGGRALGGGMESSLLEKARPPPLFSSSDADYDLDSRKFRWDKPSRLIRLERGGKCFRFTLLFLSVLIVFSGYFQFDLPAITVNQLLPKLNIGMEQFSCV
jgi:hypothetical protein